MRFTISTTALTALRMHAARDRRVEACGILLGRGTHIAEARATANAAADPATRFEIDPAALIAAYKAERAGGPAVIGFYHSHPSGVAEPSATDVAMAAGDGRVWVIATEDAVAAWVIGGTGVERVALEVV